MSKIVNVTDETFEKEVIKNALPVLVDFWAEWCGPCKRLAPHLETLANKEEVSKICIAKVNVDESPEAPSRYGIRSIPTLILFQNGRPAGMRTAGGMTDEQIKTWVTETLSAS